MTETQNKNDEFLSALTRFEKCMVTPIIPGELPTWLRDSRNSCAEVGRLLQHEVDETHDQLLREIAHQDMELAPRIEELKAKDKDLLVLWNNVRDELDQLCDRAEQIEPHEAKLDEQVEHFADKTLDFVIAARKQDAALTTWHMEAFHRDRGIGD